MKKRRSKSEPTKGDRLAQDYRNRAAMQRVYDSAVMVSMGLPAEVIKGVYWLPRSFGS